MEPGAAEYSGDDELKQELRSRALGAGFFDARIAPARLENGHVDRLRDWLAAGMHGEMAYMERLSPEQRATAEAVLPGARSVIVLGAGYHPGHEAEGAHGAEPRGEAMAKIAKYALGRDYHLALRERMAPLVEWLRGALPGHEWRACVDSAPLLERAYAVASGLGFFGRNSMVIAPRGGSFFLLCEIVTTAGILPDHPVGGTCGTCSRCIDACPTGAITAAGVVDARRCLSYLTIEKKSPLAGEERDAVGRAGWAFGCDACQDVCPYNKRPHEVAVREFAEGLVARRIEPVATLLGPASNRQFEHRFRESPILRPGRRRVLEVARAIEEWHAGGGARADDVSPRSRPEIPRAPLKES